MNLWSIISAPKPVKTKEFIAPRKISDESDIDPITGPTDTVLPRLYINILLKSQRVRWLILSLLKTIAASCSATVS
jgi:hypothetical protein